ncbi:DUF2254 domain-containing protein [Massilia sp. R798]|uniref:DUF2254 domain-containing protein n=1 Tax=Massilia soli TaxID=2792854 RepID=A0ABS7SUA7_9BURK|nr:DUF2254 domain-containing protein [Massilia soli]
MPALIIASLMLLAFGLVELDRHVDGVAQQRWPRLFTTEADGARGILSTIAGVMATIAGVTFSITMVALTLASAQYTPRVMRNFMRDKGNQAVLGIFVGIFLYCLLVLRAVSEQPVPFVPAFAVLGSVLLSVLGSAAFIFFIHHISSTIQAAEMAQAITQETLRMIDKYFPGDGDSAGGVPRTASAPAGLAWHAVPARQWGTIQTVAEEQLLAWACRHDAIVRIEHRPGQFVGQDATLASVAMRLPPDEQMIDALNRAFGIDAFRTLDQDPAFGVRQLVDMALKALSPGINDSTTAVTCLDHMGVILAYCGRRDLTPRHRYDEHGSLRVLSIGIDYEHLASLAFSQVAESAQGNTEVLLKILDTIARAGQACGGSAERRALLHQAEVTGEIALRSARSQDAKERLDARLRALTQALAA